MLDPNIFDEEERRRWERALEESRTLLLPMIGDLWIERNSNDDRLTRPVVDILALCRDDDGKLNVVYDQTLVRRADDGSVTVTSKLLGYTRSVRIDDFTSAVFDSRGLSVPRFTILHRSKPDNAFNTIFGEVAWTGLPTRLKTEWWRLTDYGKIKPDVGLIYRISKHFVDAAIEKLTNEEKKDDGPKS